MNQIQIKDKRFAVSIPEADILKEVSAVSQCAERLVHVHRRPDEAHHHSL